METARAARRDKTGGIRMDLERLKREWVNPASQNGKIQAEIWDARAGEYGEKEIPDRENNDFLKDLWGKVGIQKEMEVLDIGCGNGLYSMALAPYVKAVSLDGYVEETVTTSIVTIYWQV